MIEWTGFSWLYLLLKTFFDVDKTVLTRCGRGLRGCSFPWIACSNTVTFVDRERFGEL
jgi:hypothetical protein